MDLLSTGVDIPDLEFIVFLRTVKSRILFEQMLGRGTRLGEHYPDKSHFTVFDCFDGTLLEYFRQATGITNEAPAPPSRSIVEIIDDIWSNRDRSYNVGCLVKRLQRVDKEMSGEARDDFAAFVADGDLKSFAKKLRQLLDADFVETMKLLRDPAFQNLLVHYKRPPRTFVVAYGTQDTVESRRVLIQDGEEIKPDDYLEEFARFVKDNPARIEAFRILLDRPADWSAAALSELRQKLTQSRRFRIETLEKAHELRYDRALVDIISMVKHAAHEEQPLLTAPERVQRAFDRITAGHTYSPDQQLWLDRIRVHLVENLSIDRDDFDLVPVFTREGGWPAANRAFEGRLGDLIQTINEAVAA